MKNKLTTQKSNSKSVEQLIKNVLRRKNSIPTKQVKLPKILVVTTFPPRECGIATYSQDLVKALNTKFKKSFDLKICALENGNHCYENNVDYILETNNLNSYLKLADEINADDSIHLVLIQHEFGLFKNNEDDLLQFLNALRKSILIAFHTVLPEPNQQLQDNVSNMTNAVDGVIAMTNSSATILENDYLIPKNKISIIPHGTHLVEHKDKETLKKKYELEGRKVLSTFGLLSSGKSIETTLDALPSIIEKNPEVLFLIIGKTHPTVVKEEVEKYRNMLEEKIESLHLKNNIQFVNKYLSLPDLLEYLQLTDIYLFTSKDPNQAVSGTFSYAMSCGCPIISTPMPHACEVLKNGTGIIVDFENPKQLAKEVIDLLSDEKLMKNISLNGLHQMTPTSWENSAIAHAKLFEIITEDGISLQYKIPEINLNHLKRMTTNFGIIQFSVINKPDIDSGFTLDDNARSLIAMCQHYQLTNDKTDLELIHKYFNFIEYCYQENGYFLNYVDEKKEFTDQNYQTNLEDSNGRAIWALGFLLSISDLLPSELVEKAKKLVKNSLLNVSQIHSTRAMAFTIKGIYYFNLKNNSPENVFIIKQLADRMVQMYKHEADSNWQWFESYLTYANSVLPEALLFAWRATSETQYKTIAQIAFDFLILKIFKNKKINVVSNKGWLHNVEEINLGKIGGEQPIDVAYTILALNEFYTVFKDEEYKQKIKIAFSWFLGNNHLHQIIYNPCTGGCYDGLEDTYINLNQGAESTISYLMARLTIEKQLVKKQNEKKSKKKDIKINREISFPKDLQGPKKTLQA
jgi:glycosyltransferase involved in cell wall biosynthesis